MPLIVRVPENAEIVRRRNGYRRHLNILDRKATAVQRQIRREGLAGYEPATQASILALCQLQDRVCFYDIGAHIGIYSALVTSIFGPTAIVHAFEPTPATAELAVSLAEKNWLNIHVHEMAVSSFEGAADLFISSKAETSNSLQHGFRKSDEQVTVRVATLDALVASGFPAPNVIKIDVETHEPDVLAGALGVIYTHRPSIVAEFLPRADSPRARDILARLQRLGYFFYHLGVGDEWQAADAVGVLANTDSDYRDWLLAPAEISPEFYQAYRLWRAAISRCDQSTNIEASGGGVSVDMLREVYRPNYVQ